MSLIIFNGCKLFPHNYLRYAIHVTRINWSWFWFLPPSSLVTAAAPNPPSVSPQFNAGQHNRRHRQTLGEEFNRVVVGQQLIAGKQ